MSTRAAPAPFLVLLTLVMGAIMAMLDVTAVNLALPDIARNLGVPLSGLVWVVDGYTLSFGALLLAGGALADRYGPKAVYQAGLALFVVASVLCGGAAGGQELLAARLLQGAGAALFMPSSLSLLSHAFEQPRVRAAMLGRWSALIGLASAAGPLVGGVLVQQFGWRSVFWLNLPLGLLGIGLAQALIAPVAAQARALSLAGHALGAAALTALSFALIEGPAFGWGSAPVLGAAALAAGAALLLVRRERRGADPLLPPVLLRTAGFGAANGTGFLINFGVFGQLFLLSLYLGQGGALQAGVRLLPMMAAVIIGNLLSGRIAARLGGRHTMLAGLAGAALVTLALARLTPATPYPLLALGAAAVNVALGVAIPAMTATLMQMAGWGHANSAAAALNANRQIGALVGVALMGTILHQTPDWAQRLALGFGAIALAYGLAVMLVWRRLRPRAGL